MAEFKISYDHVIDIYVGYLWETQVTLGWVLLASTNVSDFMNTCIQRK